MNAIQIADNKTLKLINVLSRKLEPEDMGNLPLVLTQMENVIKSNGGQPVGPLIQRVTVDANGEAEVYMMRQSTQLIARVETGYHMDAVLRVRNCCYAHFTGPLNRSQLASQKIQIHAFENDIKLKDNVYTIFVNQDEDDAIVDVFMETC